MLFFELLPRSQRAHAIDDFADLERIYGFADWCLHRRDLKNAAAVSFFEHAFDNPPPQDVARWLSPFAIQECYSLWPLANPERLDKIVAALEKHLSRTGKRLVIDGNEAKVVAG